MSSTTVLVALDEEVMPTVGYGALEASTNGGASFTSHALPNLGHLIDFGSKTDGIFVGGGGDDRVYATANGGGSWTPLVVTPPVKANWRAGLPIAATGAAVRVPVVVTETDGPTQSVTKLYVMRATPSSDSVEGTPLALAGPSVAVASTRGGDALVIAGNARSTRVLSSSDQGKTWSASPAGGLPSGWVPERAVMSGPSSAVVLVAKGTCVQKTNCTQQSALFSTSDRGASWEKANL